MFAIADTPRFGVRSSYAIAAAFSDRSVLSTITRAVVKAARTELSWLIGR